MTDDFFQQLPHNSPSQESTSGWSFLFRCLFYTSLSGFVIGAIFGYLHIKGWGPNAEEGLILYGVALCIGTILSTCFVLYQVRQNSLKTEKIRTSSRK